MPILTPGSIALGVGTTGYYPAASAGSLSAPLHPGVDEYWLLETEDASFGVPQIGWATLGNQESVLADVIGISVDGVTYDVVVPATYDGTFTAITFEHMNWTAGTPYTVEFVRGEMPTIIEQQITDTANDGHFLTTFSITSTSVVLSDTRTPIWRFPGIAVPQGATITYASIKLTTKTIDTAPVGNFRAVAGNTASLATYANLAAIPLTTAGVSVTLPVSVDATFSTTITSIIQEAVNNGSWASDDALGVVLQRTAGGGSLYDYGDGSNAATLEVRWIVGGPVDPNIISQNFRTVYDGKRLSHPLHADKPGTTWSIIGGADSADFEIYGNIIRKSGNAVFDYDNPEDADSNNIYSVTVRVTDADTLTADQTLTFTIAKNATSAAIDRDERLDTDNIDLMGEDDKAAQLIDADYWYIIESVISTVYQGINWSLRYLGVRSDADIYVGSGTLR